MENTAYLPVENLKFTYGQYIERWVGGFNGSILCCSGIRENPKTPFWMWLAVECIG